MKRIAIVICNYNGGSDTINCIRAINAGSMDDCDIIVVDNASTDNSIELLNSEFGDSITVLQNKENLGGSGGFGRGLRHTTELGYEYIMVIDNDAFIDTDTIEKLYSYISSNPEVGIVGAKIMMLDDKERIFDFAKFMDWDKFYDGSEWNGRFDSVETEKPVECDYVAATAALIRTEALVSAGGMDEEHFIYYDDIELCQRIRMAGYKVVCLGTTKAWHRSNLNRVATNTFGRYYITRNRYRFFAKYLPEERLEDFAEFVIDQTFPYIYGSHRSGREDMFLTYKYILEDFMNDVRGKAREGRINTILNVWPDNIEKLVGDNKRIAICMLDGGRETTFNKLVDAINLLEADVTYDRVSSIDDGNYDLVIALCDHVKDQHTNILPAVYIDAHGNIINDYNAYLYFQNYDNAYELFKHMYKPSIMEGIQRIRSK